MVKIIIFVLSFLAVPLENLFSVVVTRYGYPGDPFTDSNSRQGIGSTGFSAPGSLNAVQAQGLEPVALSPDVASANNLQMGQQFSATINGQPYNNLVYADTTANSITIHNADPNNLPAGATLLPNGDAQVPITGRVDFFDPNGQFTGIDGAQVSAINGGPIAQLAAAGGGNLFFGNDGGAAAAEFLNAQVVNPLLDDFKTASAKWTAPLKAGIQNMFYILALISLVWTFFVTFFRGGGNARDFMGSAIEYVVSIGFFYWLMINGDVLATAILNTLRLLGGQASGHGQDVFPADLVTIGLSVFNAQVNPLVWLLPHIAIPSMIMVILILGLLGLTAANLVCLIIASWILAFAGVIVLGFGASPWTRDIAINYLRSILGVGLQLFTMELIIGLGIDFLNTTINNMGGYGALTNIGAIVLLLVAVIILCVIAHKIPMMVAGMVTGSSYHSGIGTLSLLGAGFGAAAAYNVGSRLAGGAGAAVSGGISAIERIMEQTALARAGNVSGNGTSGNGSSNTPAGAGSSQRPEV